MKPSAYIETSVISYLTGRPSRDLIVAAHQQITTDWWERHREHYRLYISEFVSLEASKGDVHAAEKRMIVVNQLELLEVNEIARELAMIIIQKGLLPREAVEDAFHIAVATVHRVDYLVTWNCKHIANAEIQKIIAKTVAESGFELPTICTPEELLGE
ncbi:MAG: DNA-binding protein [Bacteroidetes bacterium]|nr:MAG: DNA-binding protein [Bacteroidota bacterium]